MLNWLPQLFTESSADTRLMTILFGLFLLVTGLGWFVDWWRDRRKRKEAASKDRP